MKVNTNLSDMAGTMGLTATKLASCRPLPVLAGKSPAISANSPMPIGSDELAQLDSLYVSDYHVRAGSLATANRQKIERNVAQSLTGYPQHVVAREERLAAMAANLQNSPPSVREYFAGAGATLRAVGRETTDPKVLDALSVQMDKLERAALDERNRVLTDPTDEVLGVFNAPAGTVAQGERDATNGAALNALRQSFLAPGKTPAQREQLFRQAATLKANLQEKLGNSLDTRYRREAVKWNEANARVDGILGAAGSQTDPGLRYETIGRQLFTNTPGEDSDRAVLAFTDRLRNDPGLHDKLAQWYGAAAGKLNQAGVAGGKRYESIVQNPPAAGPDYVRDLSDRFNTVLQDNTSKDISVSPKAKAERLAGQIVEGVARFMLDMFPLTAPFVDELMPRSVLPENARLGIDVGTALLSAALPGGEMGAVAKEVPQALRQIGALASDVAKTTELTRGETAAAAAVKVAGFEVDRASELLHEQAGTPLPIPSSYAVQRPEGLSQVPGQRDLYHDASGSRYIHDDAHWYPVRYDADNGTLRVWQSDNAYKPQYPVRPAADGGFEVHNNVGLKGGMMSDPDAASSSAGPWWTWTLAESKEHQPLPRLAEGFTVASSSGAPVSPELTQAMDVLGWKSQANGAIDDPAFKRDYRAAFDAMPAKNRGALRSWTAVGDSDSSSSASSHEAINYRLNSSLYNREPQSFTASLRDNLAAALDELPAPGDGPQKLLRTAQVPADYATRFKVGDLVTNSPAFMSASSSNTFADQAIESVGGVFIRQSPAIAIYDIEGLTAKPTIEGVSTNLGEEREWIFRPNTVFRVAEIASAAPNEAGAAARLAPRVGVRLVEEPFNGEESLFAKNIYSGDEELVYAPNVKPSYTPLQPKPGASSANV
ncbi:hypothetical protein [Paraburkholderia sp. BCC1884]|uniref:hypothetical protein n=1 Tax=Paraburkholderia sp. BCC1884 TaxID=2562668 RepID=UPI001182EFFF|nr:hypothetical protein [Paraburkholderia sp. BCC1884]